MPGSGRIQMMNTDEGLTDGYRMSGTCVTVLSYLTIAIASGVAGYHIAEAQLHAHHDRIIQSAGIRGSAVIMGALPGVYAGLSLLAGCLAGYKKEPAPAHEMCGGLYMVSPLAWFAQRAMSACTYKAPEAHSLLPL